MRVETHEYFTQRKYNLLREECEGYSKLIVDMHKALAVGTAARYSVYLLYWYKSANSLLVQRIFAESTALVLQTQTQLCRHCRLVYY